MAKVYQIECSKLGVDCEFSTQADSIEKVIELCADHGREHQWRLQCDVQVR